MKLYPFFLVLIAAGVTMLTRFAPFLLLGRGEEPPSWVRFLGNVLPPAVMSVLLLYCLKNVEFTSQSHGLPEILSVLWVMLLHAWKRNTLLSIGTGTVLYMLLVQWIF